MLKFRCFTEGIKIDVKDDGIVIIVRMFKPTKDEVKAFNSPSRIQLKEGMICGQIFFTVKAGDLNWMDAPYSPLLSIHLSENGKKGSALPLKKEEDCL